MSDKSNISRFLRIFAFLDSQPPNFRPIQPKSFGQIGNISTTFFTLLAKRIFRTTVILVAASVSSSAIANDSLSYQLKANVPVTCKVEFYPIGSDISENIVRLGELSEYCNAPDGYKLEVRYTPDTLHGVILNLGKERVVLDGSGFALIPGASGPRSQKRWLSAQVDKDGFDAREFQIAIVVN